MDRPREIGRALQLRLQAQFADGIAWASLRAWAGESECREVYDYVREHSPNGEMLDNYEASK